MKKILFPLIKILSTCLIISAIGLELWHYYGTMGKEEILVLLKPVFWVDRFVLTAHFIEGIIAVGYTLRRNREPFPYAIYVFFVGTVGLVELFRAGER